MDLSDVTIVILSRGREELLNRTLKFWSSENVNIVVLHKTSNPIESLKLGKNIRYYVDDSPFGIRCGRVEALIQTEFVILSSDDEIYVPSAIYEMKMALKNEPKVSSVGALTFAIGRYGRSLTGTFCYSKMQNYVNRASNQYERLLQHFSYQAGYRNGGMYRLLRSDLMIQLMKSFRDISSFSTPYVYEVTAEIIVNSHGPSFYLNNIYWIRNWINDQVIQSDWDRNLYFYRWIESEQFREEVTCWNQVLSRNLQMDTTQYLDVLNRVIKLRRESEEYEIASLTRRNFRIPTELKWALRKVLAPRSMPKGIEEALLEMSRRGAVFSYEEISNAISHITP